MKLRQLLDSLTSVRGLMSEEKGKDGLTRSPDIVSHQKIRIFNLEGLRDIKSKKSF